MNLKTLSVQISKGERDGQWVLGASGRDRVDDTIAPAAFRKALSQIGGKLIALWQHNPDNPVGYWDNLKEQGGQLIGDLRLADTNLSKMIRKLLEHGTPLGASIGFRGLDGDVNEFGGIHYKDIALLETSIVSVPCQPAAVQIAKSYGFTPESLTNPGPAPGSASAADPIEKSRIEIERARALLLESKI